MSNCQRHVHQGGTRLSDHFVGFPLLAVPRQGNTDGLNFARSRLRQKHRDSLDHGLRTLKQAQA